MIPLFIFEWNLYQEASINIQQFFISFSIVRVRFELNIFIEKYGTSLFVLVTFIEQLILLLCYRGKLKHLMCLFLILIITKIL